MSQPNKEQVLDLLIYEPDTGLFFWRVNRRGQKKQGDKAGGVSASTGYIYIGLGNRKRYAAHRLAWLCTHGEWPDGEIDHINGVRSDNRIVNLRVVTPAANRQNMQKARGQVGLLGVRRNGKRFSALIKLDYKSHYLGTFDTPEEAHQAYVTAKRALHPAGML